MTPLTTRFPLEFEMQTPPMLVERRPIKIRIGLYGDPDAPTRTIDAIVCGDWAAHPSPGTLLDPDPTQGSSYGITHAPSGLALGPLASNLGREHATALVAALGSAVPAPTMEDVAPQVAVIKEVIAAVARKPGVPGSSWTDQRSAEFATAKWIEGVGRCPPGEIVAMVAEDRSVFTTLLGALRHARAELLQLIALVGTHGDEIERLRRVNKSDNRNYTGAYGLLVKERDAALALVDTRTTERDVALDSARKMKNLALEAVGFLEASSDQIARRSWAASLRLKIEALVTEPDPRPR